MRNLAIMLALISFSGLAAGRSVLIDEEFVQTANQESPIYKGDFAFLGLSLRSSKSMVVEERIVPINDDWACTRSVINKEVKIECTFGVVETRRIGHGPIVSKTEVIKALAKKYPLVWQQRNNRAPAFVAKNYRDDIFTVSAPYNILYVVIETCGYHNEWMKRWQKAEIEKDEIQKEKQRYLDSL